MGELLLLWGAREERELPVINHRRVKEEKRNSRVIPSKPAAENGIILVLVFLLVKPLLELGLCVFSSSQNWKIKACFGGG